MRRKAVYNRETINLQKGSFPAPTLAKNQAKAAERIETQNSLLGMLINAEKEVKRLLRERQAIIMRYKERTSSHGERD